MKAARWLMDRWYLPLVVLAIAVGWMLGRSKGAPPASQVKRELDAIEAGAKARRLAAELGAAKALEHVEKEHAEVVARLDAEDKAKAERLKHDPAALSRFLVRAGSRRS